MKARFVLRLSLVIALLGGLVSTLLSVPMRDVPQGIWFVFNWLLDGILIFVLTWIVLSLLGWAVRAFSQ